MEDEFTFLLDIIGKPELKALYVLHDLDYLGPFTLGEISRRTRIKSARLEKMLYELFRYGFVVITPAIGRQRARYSWADSPNCRLLEKLHENMRMAQISML